MGYRDDLGAAQARADAISRELESEKAGRIGDADRLATLEHSLATALEELATLRSTSMSEKVYPAVQMYRENGTKIALIGFSVSMVLVLGMLGVGYILAQKGYF